MTRSSVTLLLALSLLCVQAVPAREVSRTGGLNQKVYEEMVEIQTLIDEGDVSRARRKLERLQEDKLSDYELAQTPMAGISQPIGSTVLDGGLLSPTLANPLVAGYNGDPMQFLNSETSGVDLNFRVGVATTNTGDIQLGLAFTRVLDAEFQGLYANGFEALDAVYLPSNDAVARVFRNLDYSPARIEDGLSSVSKVRAA